MKAFLVRHAGFLALVVVFLAAIVLAPCLAAGDRAARGAREPESPTRRTLGPRPVPAPIEWGAPDAAE
ncbi:MAG: hypothetical protein AB7T63_07200 [Planctomycetota bacterium]